MKTKIIEFVKNNKYVYILYYYGMSFIINVLKFFVKPQDNLILFITAGGKRYMDSPRNIYEMMIEDERFNSYELVWAFRNPEQLEIPGRAKIIKIDSLEYYITALKARCWITNVSVERGLNFKGKNTFYLNTWHGTAIKKVGFDISNAKTFHRKGEMLYDIICGQGEYDRRIYHSAFAVKDEKILLCGFPRNDSLYTADECKYYELREKLGIPKGAKAILYAPTFHDTVTDRSVFAPPIHLEKWLEELGENYYILLRTHPSVFEVVGVNTDSERIINVSTYPEINDLYIASDMLISDYSSVFFDYSILTKPMFCFAYDYSEYARTRGVYINICEELTGGEIDEDALLYIIKNADEEYEIENAKRFNQKYISASGNATKIVLDYIYNQITKGE